MYSQAACTYRGRLFVIGSSHFEPNERLFRATAMDVPEYPGDLPYEEDPVEPDDPVSPVDPVNPSVQPSPSGTGGKASGTAAKATTQTSAKPVSQKLPKTGDVPAGHQALMLVGMGFALLVAARRMRNAS